MKKKSVIIISIVLLLVIILGAVFVILNKDSLFDTSLSTSKQIIINVYDKENKEIYNEKVSTDETYLANALEKMDNLNIQMQDSEYGKYITSILDINEGDGYYWSYYINNEYASIGISNCEIVDDATYSFKIEKFEY